LAIQRFTGAHELGHLVMGHSPSLDEENILGCSPTALPPQEIEANAFAAEFLGPRWLLAYHARKQGWDATSMQDPVCAYQMALRIGMSYEATCRTLLLHKLIAQGTMQSLIAIQPKQIKRSILPSSHEPENWIGDVWLLGDGDQGSNLEGQPEDLFVIKLREKSGSGYLWNKDQLRSEGFNILTEMRFPLNDADRVGGDSLYEIALKPPAQSVGRIELAQSRPWQKTAPLNVLNVTYDIQGKEYGMSRAERRQRKVA
jgi:predicted secreted protein